MSRRSAAWILNSVLAAGWVWGSSAIRTLEEGGPANAEIDWTFMTESFQHPGHSPGFFGTIRETIWRGRARGDEKEEIVAGHACQKKGDYTQTYYASSLCYWIPDILAPNRGKPTAGLTWEGGKSSRQALCSGVSAKGKCVKCSACHNNARAGVGEVKALSWMEELPLPSGCLMESQIEAKCKNEHEEANKPLKEEVGRCEVVRKKWEASVQTLRDCLQNLEDLPKKINVDLPQQLQDAQAGVVRYEERSRASVEREFDARRRMEWECEDYKRVTGWADFNIHGRSTEDFLVTWNLRCWQPIHHHTDPNYNRHDQEVYEYCQRCQRAKEFLESLYNEVKENRKQLSHQQREVRNVREHIQRAERELRDLTTRQPHFTESKRAMEAEWLPQKGKCEEDTKTYGSGLQQGMATCVPGYYDQSCEKKCLELQAESDLGCGVVEGSTKGDAFGRGGPVAACDPPQPSWVMGPWNYVAQEPKEQQCQRVMAHQAERRAQSVLQAGWLWKQGTNIGWEKRYFVLESGDQVRSPQLRYFEKDPKQVSTEERSDKALILWDAKGTKAKDGTHYKFKDGSECFKIYHVYRKYRLCVPGDSVENPAEVRDSWLKFVTEAIRFKI